MLYRGIRYDSELCDGRAAMGGYETSLRAPVTTPHAPLSRPQICRNSPPGVLLLTSTLPCNMPKLFLHQDWVAPECPTSSQTSNEVEHKSDDESRENQFQQHPKDKILTVAIVRVADRCLSVDEVYCWIQEVVSYGRTEGGIGCVGMNGENRGRVV